MSDSSDFEEEAFSSEDNGASLEDSDDEGMGKKRKLSKPKETVKGSKVQKIIQKSSPSSSVVTASTTKVSLNVANPPTYDISEITNHGDVTTESSTKKLVLKYFTVQNRPYSANQIYDNFHKRIAKSVVDRVLSSLCENSSGLRYKEYGKTKIFFLDQNSLGCDINSTQISALDLEINNLSKELKDMQEREKNLIDQMNILAEQPKDNEIEGIIDSLRKEVTELQNRVKKIDESSCDVDVIQAWISHHNAVRNIWKSRKEQCMEVIDTIAEGAGKKTSDIANEVGIETDEDNGTKIPPPISLENQSIKR